MEKGTGAIVVPVSCELAGADEALGKIEELVRLLERAQALADEISRASVEVRIRSSRS